MPRAESYDAAQTRRALAAGCFLLEAARSAKAYWLFSKPVAGERLTRIGTVSASVTAEVVASLDLKWAPMPAEYHDAMKRSGRTGWGGVQNCYVQREANTK